jgi:hypothetical protein
MDFLYVFTVDGAEWEDLVIYLSKEEAIAKSKKFPKVRLDIYKKTEDGYRPTYKFYLNGELVYGS